MDSPIRTGQNGIAAGLGHSQAIRGARTNPIYLADGARRTWVLSEPTDTVVATVHAGSEPLDVAADPQAKTICVTGNGDNTVTVFASCRGTSSRPLPVAAERKHQQAPNPRPGG